MYIVHRHVVPGVMVYLKFHPTFHAWVAWVSEIKYELIAAARGARSPQGLHKLTFDLTQYCKPPYETIYDMCGI